ncbi:hypothetical protein ABZP36_004426 [Zizania latifolia]
MGGKAGRKAGRSRTLARWATEWDIVPRAEESEAVAEWGTDVGSRGEQGVVERGIVNGAQCQEQGCGSSARPRRQRPYFSLLPPHTGHQALPAFAIMWDPSDTAEEEPKFIPFTSLGRHLNGKSSKDKEMSASSPTKRQANATKSVQPSTATTSQSSSLENSMS